MLKLPFALLHLGWFIEYILTSKYAQFKATT